MRWSLLLLVFVGCKAREPESAVAVPVAEPTRVVDAVAPVCKPEDGTFCAGDEVAECTGDGQRGRTVMSCKAGCKRGSCVETCAAKDVELVYVVDDANNLLSFDPRKLPQDPFAQVGKLDCDTRASPFSMAVDNRGIAWVLYDDGTLFRVSIIDAHCARKGHQVKGAPSQFGMGFVNAGAAEALYVADDDDEDGKGQLAIVDTSGDVPTYTPVGKLLAQQSVNPELTGTADGKLYGYFPDPNRGFVSEIDRKTARAVGPRRQLPDIGRVGAYAFAHWGGTFYIFAGKDAGFTAVHAIDRKTGAYRLIQDETQHRIVGAGVSTCAPLLERVP